MREPIRDENKIINYKFSRYLDDQTHFSSSKVESRLDGRLLTRLVSSEGFL